VSLDLARYIDHTLLAPDATASEIDQICEEAVAYGFASVCINPTWVRRVAQQLRGTAVLTCSVVGFPFGATLPQIKAMEARRVIRDGAREVDMVINVGALKAGDVELVGEDIQKVVHIAHGGGAICKVIIETAMLSDEEKVLASALTREARADFVKTSTGFGGGGATIFDVALLKETVGPKLGVKASGGVRTAADARAMLAAGATRIGTSAGVEIVTGDE